MKVIKTLFAFTVMLLAFSACSNEDDIDEIFVGRTWYMTGIAFNGSNNSEETRNFYMDTDASCYYISFSSGTFQGKLSSGVSFSGTWEANGKHQSIELHLKEKPNPDALFDKQLVNILSDAHSYSSGADFMNLSDTNQNTIRFGTIR